MTGLVLILLNLYLFYRYESTRRYYRAYTYFTDTGVPVGTTGLILIRTSRRSYRVSSYAELILITDVCSFGTPVGVTELNQIQEYPYVRQNLSRYRSTSRYYRTNTEVPVGTFRSLLYSILYSYSESSHIIVGLPRPVIRNE